jgi:two-component system, chemotaxis family, response regulator Rcp1
MSELIAPQRGLSIQYTGRFGPEAGLRAFDPTYLITCSLLKLTQLNSADPALMHTHTFNLLMASAPVQPNTGSQEPREILHVEDNPGDVRLMQDALNKTGTKQTYHTFSNAADALEFLDERPSLDIALLDLDLPGRDGCEILKEIRKMTEVEHLPVIMLSGSDADKDVRRCYDAHANAYLTKPNGSAGFLYMAELITEFWFEQSELPVVPS